ncbi:MAG: C40 family peptidase [Actinomycetota bacterium]|nr:C40 family peptidase [Actinomycetota bacterium]
MACAGFGLLATVGTPHRAAASTLGDTIVAAASSQVNLPYCFTGGDANGPTHGTGGSGCGGSTVGFDCSGLVLYAYAQAGINFTGHFTDDEHDQAIAMGAQVVSASAATPGTLIFFHTTGGTSSNGGYWHHVGIYSGSGMMWNAPDFNQPVQQDNVFSDDIVQYVQLPALAGSTSPPPDPIHPETVGSIRPVSGAWQYLLTNNPGTNASGHTGALNQWVNFGNSSTDTPLVGDWDGNGSATAGFARIIDGHWRFYGSNNPGTDASGHTAALSVWQDWPNTVSSDVPLVGDWDGNGTDTPGFARKVGSSWRFYGTNNPGTDASGHTAVLNVWQDFGSSTYDVPLVGDWDGNGTDTPGTARPVSGAWQFLETNNPGTDASGHAGALSQWLNFGSSTYDTPVVGDWDGNGTSTPGTARPVSGAWQFLETNNPGTDASGHTGALNQWLNWGNSAYDTPVTGRWS